MQDFRETLIFQINNKKIIVKEPLVGDYFLLKKSPEDFIKKFKLKNIENEQLQEIITKMFEIEQNLEDILQTKKENEEIHIIIAKLVKYFGNSFSDFMNMTWNLFCKITQDFEKIIEEKNKEKKQVGTGKEGLRKLKNIF